jgi:FkbH-like protein
LTTRRYTLAELESIANDSSYIGIYGRLADRFGDNGLISVVLGSIKDRGLHLDLWLMSCRVLKREMEIAMLDGIVERVRMKGLAAIYGYYLPTAKNGMVADHYEKLGFTLVSKDESANSTVWALDISNYEPRTSHIRILEPAHG